MNTYEEKIQRLNERDRESVNTNAESLTIVANEYASHFFDKNILSFDLIDGGGSYFVQCVADIQLNDHYFIVIDFDFLNEYTKEDFIKNIDRLRFKANSMKNYFSNNLPF